MGQHRLDALFCFLLLSLFNQLNAQANFEDAEKLSDLVSSGQHFDLRHTIPGIPEVDYPIYSHVPETSFVCTERHEGYYADIESRCQAFRICTHTARSVHGFGFLCPNGTLFNQKYFVCDWYRNVNCDDSERFYSKNDDNRIGSSFDMLETVRQMIEYPMKTITKALQSNPSPVRQPTQRTRTINKSSALQSNETVKELDMVRSRSRPASGRKSVTRDQVESAHNRGSAKYGREKALRNKEEISKNIENNGYGRRNSSPTTKNESISSSVLNDDDVYVNSLGELSTDPGVVFDRTNAHIIAEPRRQRYQNRMNFAQKVNAGLNDLMDSMPANETMAPDYIKLLRDSSNDTPKIDLSSNINGLLDEIANDLDTSFSGYPQKKAAKATHTFRFLSRGFSSQNDPYKYIKPKQTPSTIRFTPNQLPIEEEKQSKKPSLKLEEDVISVDQSTTKPPTTETTKPEEGVNDYETSQREVPPLEDASYLSPPILEPTGITDLPTDEVTGTTILPNRDEIDSIASDSPEYAAFVETTTALSETDSSKIESSDVSDITRSFVASPLEEHNQKLNAEESPIDEDRINVHEQAASLFISGLHLTKNENTAEAVTIEGAETTQPPLLIHVPDDLSYLTDSMSSTMITTTDATPTATTQSTTEISPESGSLQARLRNYRRLSSLQRAKAKPLVYGKRAGVRMNSNTTTTTPKPTVTTRSYLKRIAASRLRLSRLAAAGGNKSNLLSVGTNPLLSPVDNTLDSNSNKKIIVRNINRETATINNNIVDSKDVSKVELKTDKNTNIPTWESVKNSLQRFQTSYKDLKSSLESTTIAADLTSTSRSSSTITHNPLMRMRNRSSFFKAQQLKAIETTREPTTTVATSTSVSVSSSSLSSASVSRSSSSSSFSKFLPLSLYNSLQNIAPSPLPAQSTSLVESSESNNRTPPTSSNSFPHGATADNTNLNSNSATAPDSYISFDKLTRSIVDDSILQTYRAGPILGRSSLSTSPSSSSSISRNDLGRESSGTASSAFAQAPSPTQQQSRPQSLAHLPLFSISPTGQPTTSGRPVLVARAEGQRIAPDYVSSIISSLISEKQQKSKSKPVPNTPYEPLNYFLTREFGSLQTKKDILDTSTKFNTPFSPNQQQQQLQYSQPKEPLQQLQYNRPQTKQNQQIQQNVQQQYQQNRPFQPQQYQRIPQQMFQSQQQPQYQLNQQRNSPLSYSQQLNPNNNYQTTLQFGQRNQLSNLYSQFQTTAPPTVSPLLTQNIFETFKQQQQQLPTFPPLAAAPPTPSQNPTQFDDTNNFLNVQLPSLPNGLIPTPNNQIAQKRSDISTDELQFTDYTSEKSILTGASSYDVPLNSIGRLPNDKQALFYLRY